jgi:hypothetical protein
VTAADGDCWLPTAAAYLLLLLLLLLLRLLALQSCCWPFPNLNRTLPACHPLLRRTLRR